VFTHGIHMCLYVCLCACVCVCIYIYIYIYAHVYACVLRISRTRTKSSTHCSMCVFMFVLVSCTKTKYSRMWDQGDCPSTKAHKCMNIYINTSMLICVLHDLYSFHACPMHLCISVIGDLYVCACIGYIAVSHLHDT
jgi:hypothetical protein